MPTSSINNVNSFQLLCSFSPSHNVLSIPLNVVVCAFSISYASKQLATGSPRSDPPIQYMLGYQYFSARFWSFLLGLPPIDAKKLWCELCFHPNQVKVDYVITSLTSGFHPSFDPLVVSLKSTVHNMPSAPLQPLVIDQYLLIWHMINYSWHPGETTIPAGLTNCSIFAFLGDVNFSSHGIGLSFLLSPIWALLPDFSVSSDAAGTLDYGEISGHEWFVGKWSITQQPLSIT